MPVVAEALEREPELHAREVPVVLGRGRLAPELAPDAMHLGRLLLDPVEESLPDEQVVRALVLRRHATLVSPPELRGAPILLERCRLLVGRSGSGATRERDVLAAA